MGNRIRVLTLVEHLGSLGYEVHFLHVNRERGDDDAMRAHWGDCFHPFTYTAPRRPKLRPWYAPYWAGRVARAWRYGERLSRHNLGLDDWYDRRLDGALRGLHARHSFDVVLVSYVFMSRAFTVLPQNVLKLLDTHDIFCDRYKLFVGAGMSPAFFSCGAHDEIRGIERADAVLAIQEEEAQYFRGLTSTPVLRTGHAVPIADHGPPPAAPSVLFVGSRNSINHEAMRRFLRDVWPKVLREVPEATLTLVGSICEHPFDAPGVIKLGEVGSLDEVYARARCVINTRHIGSGLSIKSIEAMAHGRPLVATPAGAMGLSDGQETAYLLASSDAGIAEAVVRVLRDDTVATQLAAAARAYACAYNERCFAELDAFLTHHLKKGA